MRGSKYGVAACALALFAGVSASAQSRPDAPLAAEPRIVLLGTSAGPVPRPNRSQPATLIVAGGKRYLVDAGENTSQQLAKAGVPVANLDAVFVTHLHFDHILGLPPLMAFLWMGARTAPLPIIGPAGISEYVRRSIAALDIGADIFRPQLPPRPALPALFPVQEIAGDAPAIVYRDDAVTVTAVANSHFAAAHLPARSYGADRSYSLRFDTGGKCIAVTGDTGPSAAVETLASGCDVLVAEVVDVPSVMRAITGGDQAAEAKYAAMRQHMEEEHLTPAALGALAAKAGVKKLVVTHFAAGPDVDLKQLAAELRSHYSGGEIVLGADLMEMTLGR